MALNTNTTNTIKKASIVLGKKCEETEKNMKVLAKKLYGEETPKMEKVTIPRIPGAKDDVVFAALNGQKFYFLRGKTVEMPAAIAEILRTCDVI